MAIIEQVEQIVQNADGMPPENVPEAPVQSDAQTQTLYAYVAIDQRLESELTYLVPPDLVDDVHAGSRVMVPLGRGNKTATGTVTAVTREAPTFAARAAPEAPEPHADAADAPTLFSAEDLSADRHASAIGKIADPGGRAFAAPRAAGAANAGTPAGAAPGAAGIKPIQDVVREVLPVPDDLLRLAKWISAYYCTPIGLTLSSMVPAAVKRNTRLPTKTSVEIAAAARDGEEFLRTHKLSPRSRTVFNAMHAFLKDGPRDENAVLTELGIARPMLRRLVEKGAVCLHRAVVFPEMPQAYVPRNEGAGETSASGETAVAEVAVAAPDTGAAGAVASVTNIPGGGIGDAGHCALTAEQQAALDDIDRAAEAGGFAARLLHGVTGSGKTELYIRAIEKVVARGQRAIVLVPEISLTPQTVRRFTRRFARVAVLHSGLRDAQRHQHWHAIAGGWAQVIVGARSAIFAPAANIGLIVVDEEHDGSYKQDSAPRYHGRDVAIRRAQMLGVPVVLGSATPALETWHNATGGNGHYGLLSLRTRPLGTLMPRVVVVDMKQAQRERRGLHILSTTLEHHLKRTLEQKKQALLLLNRRGYAHYCMCPRCEWVLMCDNCDATMVVHRTREGGGEEASPGAGSDEFHKKYGVVQCHYCMTSRILPPLCPLCKAKLTHLGQGTQRAQDELIRKFPNLRLARMDSDSMRDAIDYQRTLNDFANGHLDVIIGTQMIAKGLDFPNVALVGVLNADLAMTAPDFRASERTFQLICQVAGRSGRSVERGTVVVQTFQPQEPAIVHACNHDFDAFVAGELPHRRAFGYPPYGRMARIVISNKNHERAKADAQRLSRNIAAICQRYNLPVRSHGPQPPPMERLVEMYRSEIILFAGSAAPLQHLLKVLRERRILSRLGGTVAVDVDPIHLS